ncbi:MAG TPA: hypothetical protein VGN42_11170, partial [Pirellulales bacterium]|nr:hypothetical protein [Pirellulales bacterium]
LAVLLLFAALFTIGSLISSWQLEAELDKIRAADQPVTMEDLDAFRGYPSKDRDATELWRAAFGVLDSPDYQSDAKALPCLGEIAPRPGEPWPQFDAAEAFLAQYREPLEKLHRASELGGDARFPISFSDVSMPLPHLQLDNAVRLLKLESEVRVHRNDAPGAVESVRAILAAGRGLERYPFLYPQLVRMAMNGAGCSQIERLLSTFELSEQDLIRLDGDLAAIDEAAAFRRGLLGQRAYGIYAFGNPSALGPDAPAMSSWGALRTVDETAYLQVMAKYIAATESSSLPLRDAIAQTRDEVTAIMDSPSARWRYPLTRLLAPSLEESRQPSLHESMDSICRAQAEQATTRSAIAIERYRRVHGEAPEKLDQLVPEFLDQPPVDPFDGAPLRYRVDAGGYKVYSIGPDGIDQGGESGAEGQSPDIVFQVP